MDEREDLSKSLQGWELASSLRLCCASQASVLPISAVSSLAPYHFRELCSDFFADAGGVGLGVRPSIVPVGFGDQSGEDYRMAQLQHRIDELTDDSGFLGLVDPHAYTSFVGEDWTLEMLFERVESEMRQRTMLLWGTGGEEQWRIDLSDSPVDPRLPIIRQIAGPITVTRGELVVVNLDTVTMAAQFADSAVDDDKDIYGSSIELPNGDYICTISQLTDSEEDRTHEGPDFHLQLLAGRTSPWFGVAWSEL